MLFYAFKLYKEMDAKAARKLMIVSVSYISLLQIVYVIRSNFYDKMENRMTFEEEQERKGKTYKLLLWFGMISICMIFAGLTSGFIVSKKRPDWVANFNMPKSLIISTILILLSSVTFYLAKNTIKKDSIQEVSFS